MEYGDPLGPKAFPLLLGLLFARAAVLLLFESRRPRAAAAATPGRRSAQPGAVSAVVVGTALFFAVLEPLGYLIAFTIYLFLVMLWLHRKSPFTCLLVAALFSVGSYALFAKGLGVSLAKGLVYF
jgi:putative tricarboxylic transport membrane protein